MADKTAVGRRSGRDRKPVQRLEATETPATLRDYHLKHRAGDEHYRPDPAGTHRRGDDSSKAPAAGAAGRVAERSVAGPGAATQRQQSMMLSYFGVSSPAAEPASATKRKLSSGPGQARPGKAPRIGRVAECGHNVKPMLQEASALRERGQARQADAVAGRAAAARPRGKEPSEDSIQQRERRLPAALEAMLFEGSGAASCAARVVGKFLCRPAMRELQRLEVHLDEMIDLEQPMLDNDRCALRQVAENIRDFCRALTPKQGGTQHTATKEALRAALAAAARPEAEMGARKEAFHRILGVQHSAVHRAIRDRTDLVARTQEGGATVWVCKSRATYRNKYGDSLKGVLSEFMHSESRPDNSSKRGHVKVPVHVDAETGIVQYEEHEPSITPPPIQLVSKLTGRDYSQKKVLDAEAGEMLHPKVAEPSPCFARALAAHNPAKGKLTLSAEQFRRLRCDCQTFGGQRSKCAGKKKFLLEQLLGLLKKARSQWHQAADPPCDCGCDKDLLDRFCSSPANCIAASLCPAVHVPEFDLGLYDEKTAMPTGEKRQFFLRPLRCHQGKCEHTPPCGWGKVAAGCPETTASTAGAQFEPFRWCSRDASAQHKFAWYTWQKIPNAPPPSSEHDGADPGYAGGSKKQSCSTHWFPVTGTRAEFIAAVRDACVAYREHIYWADWHRIHGDRSLDRFFTQVAVRGPDKVEPWQRNIVQLHIDFAATLKIPRFGEATGAFPMHSQMCTGVCLHDPRLQRVEDLPRGKFRDKLVSEGIESYPTAGTTVVFALSNANNDAQCYGPVLAQTMEVLHTGAVPKGSKMEFFVDGVRLRGSDTSRPLSDGLRGFDPGRGTAKPLIRSGHSGAPVVRMKSDGKNFETPDRAALDAQLLEKFGVRYDGSQFYMTRLLEKRDGCKAQFQGLHAFLIYSLFQRATCVQQMNVCCQAEDGKGAADGLSLVVSSGARPLCLQGKEAGADARGVCQLVAAHKKRPRAPRELKRGFFATTRCVYCYAGEAGGSAFADFHAAKGYHGSNDDHYFTMDPSTRLGSDDDDEGSLLHGNRPCPCDQCLSCNYSDCLVRRLFKNAFGRATMQRKAGQAQRAALRPRVTKDFVESMEIGRAVVVRVHEDEDNDLLEPYYVALVSCKAGALHPDALADGEKLVWRAPKTEVVETNTVLKGTWLMRVRWLHYQPSEHDSADPNARCYKLQPGEKAVVFPATGVVTKKGPNEAMLAVVQRSCSYWLPSATHDVVMRDGLDLLP